MGIETVVIIGLVTFILGMIVGALLFRIRPAPYHAYRSYRSYRVPHHLDDDDYERL